MEEEEQQQRVQVRGGSMDNGSMNDGPEEERRGGRDPQLTCRGGRPGG